MASGETNFAALTEKTTPVSGDMFLLEDSEDTKKIDYDKLADAILNKLTTKTYSGLGTTATNIVSAIAELNSNSNYIPNIPIITSIPSGQTLPEYVTNNYPSKPSIYFFGVASTITEEQKSPFPSSGCFIILYNSSTTGYSAMYAFGYENKIKQLRKRQGVWDSNWNNV